MSNPAKPAGKTAHLSIESSPEGANVAGPDGKSLGRTPLELEWPISNLPVSFELRLAGYRKKQKQMVVTGNTALRVDLERAAAVRHPASPAAEGSASSGSGNGLMRPDD